MRFFSHLLFASLLALPVAGQPDAEPKDPPIDSDEKRDVPDYGGRGDDPTTVGDVLIWVPRVLLSPLYVISEYGLRRPFRWLISTVEEEKLPQKLVAVFTFGPDNNMALVPSGLIDFGLRPSIGLYYRWNDAFFAGNKVRARFAFGGVDWLLLNFADRVAVGPRSELGLRAEYGFRPDWLFHGFGPRSGSQRARYEAIRSEAGFGFRTDFLPASHISGWTLMRDVTFDLTQGAFDDPTVAEEIARGRYESPTGAGGYTVLLSGAELEWGTREPREPENLPEASDHFPAPGSGVRAQVRAEQGSSLAALESAGSFESRRYHWLKYGATFGGFVDLTGTQRVIGLSVIVDAVDPLFDNGEIPFTEQVSLGGMRPMRGFLEYRLIDRSAAVALFEYEWPVWVWMDGVLHYAVGNVFGPRLDGFELDLLRQSFGLGLRAAGSRDHPFEMLLAFGTRTFGDGGGIEHVRFVFGATSGF